MRIKEILKEKGISVQELADTLGVSRQALSRQIAGKCLVETIEKIATVLDVPVWQFFVTPEEVVANHKDTFSFACPKCRTKLNIVITEKK